ncbi:thiolase family protein [Variovorax sp. SRS16]|uniref:thiolase family protein n=1 Tax=Variovorax sp. SRS16 TaxID=282217 RepID=UPI001E2981B6|nr:thiolase family protein [Variovorax sp. SRS16]
MSAGTMLRDQCAIVGVGASAQGKVPGSTALTLAVDAFKAALDDSGLRKEQIDGLLTLPGQTSPESTQNFLRIGETLGINPRFAGTMNLGGSTAGALVQQAALAIHAGMATHVACVFGDAAATGGGRFDRAQGWGDSSSIWGYMAAAANSAITAARHMAVYGTTSRQLGEIAVACRYHASLNPHAVMREPITIDDHQASRWIVEPLHLLDCCLVSDGGVCIIVSSAERARDLKQPPVLLSGMGQGYTTQNLGSEDWWYAPHQKRAVQDAYAMAGVGPTDIDVAQLYDNFTPSVLLWLEHGGFCAPGEAGPFCEGGRIRLGGALPVNTAGGNLSESFMEGWLHIVEGVNQMRHQCGPRQVPDAEVCLVTGRGLALNCANALVLRRS